MTHPGLHSFETLPGMVGPYTVLGLLGVGGCAAVVRAVKEPGTEVALKICRTAGEAIEERRLRREVKLLSSLAHPGLVRLLDAGCEGQWVYYAMEIMEGGSLQDRLAAGSMSWPEALACVVPALEGLAHMHEHEVIHRDLKPPNLLFDGAGRCRVSDLGLALASNLSTITAAGAVVGTLQYMSPEMLRGDPVSARSDVYQMALILYQMVSGNLPFRSSGAATVIQEILAGNLPSLASKVPGIPGSLDLALDFCLASDPMMRPKDAGDMLKILRTIGDGSVVSPPAPAEVAVPAGDGSGWLFAGGRYAIHRLLGEGSYAEVYEATQRELGRRVALKVLRPSAPLDPGTLARFEQEAQLIARIRHPNVVRVYDTGQEEGRPWMALELVTGASLQERVRQGPIPWSATLPLLIRIARGLDAAHALGVIHRDLKLQNLLLDPQEGVKLADFGMAIGLPGMDRWTASGELPGTPSIMAPELFTGTTADVRSDLYAAGIVMYQMIAGRHPFPGRTLEEIADQHRHAPVELPAACASLPPGAGAMVRRLLAKSPHERYPSARDWLRELEALEGTTSSNPGSPADAVAAVRPRAPAAAPAHTPALAVPALLLAGLLAGALTSWMLYSITRREAPLPVTLATPSVTSVTNGPAASSWDPGAVLLLSIPVGTQGGRSFRIDAARLPGGRYLMGERDQPDTPPAGRAQPLRAVEVLPFVLARHELTEEQYLRLLEPTRTVAAKDARRARAMITWETAERLVEELRKATGLPFRLPSEAEWEYACRAGTRSTWYFGEDRTQFPAHAWALDDPAGDPGGARAVGLRRPSDFGLYDILGNVAEWVADDHHPSYVGAPAGGSAWRDPQRTSARVVRGGSFLNTSSQCRCGRRMVQSGDTLEAADMGLRVALDWDEAVLAPHVTDVLERDP